MACAQPTEFPFPTIDLKENDFFKLYNLKVQGILGEGCAGTVYLVKTDNKGGEMVAVKTFSLAGDTRARSVRLFTAEVKCMLAVSHPHLVPCYAAVQCKKYLAVAMPYYSGGDLTELHGSTDTQKIATYISEVAQALEHLHGHNFAHLDIKLDNVFLDGSDHAHLGDTGLAKELSGEDKTVAAQCVGGTMDYWPPEMFSAYLDDKMDPFKLDVYALGVIYFLLVTKTLPQANVDYQGLLKAMPAIQGLSPARRSVLESMLEPDPAKRPTASEVVAMLRK